MVLNRKVTFASSSKYMRGSKEGGARDRKFNIRKYDETRLRDALLSPLLYFLIPKLQIQAILLRVQLF